MHILLITFRLDGLGAAEFRRLCEETAPAFAELPGLISKVWLADPVTNTGGGVYTWRDRAAMESYLAGDIIAGMKATPQFADLTIRDFAVLTEPTRLTRGLPEAAMAAR